MKNVIFVLISCIALPTQAALHSSEWKEIGRADKDRTTIYMDKSTIKKYDYFRKINILIDADEPRGLYDVLSVIQVVEFNCEERTYSIDSVSNYTGNMGSGDKVASWTSFFWTGITSLIPFGEKYLDPNVKAIMNYACNDYYKFID